MKKTLALALVAAMTISMASMTAFAKEVKYNTESEVKAPEEVVAEIKSLTKDDMTKTKVVKEYKVNEAFTQDNVTGTVGTPLSVENYNKLDTGAKAKCEPVYEDGWTIKFSDLGLKTYDNTATRTFYGWTDKQDAAADNVTYATDKNPSEKDNVVGSDKEYSFVGTDFDGNGALTATALKKLGKDGKYVAVVRIDTTDEAIAKNLKAIEDKKNDGDAAQKEKDRLAELDKKYNADGKNAYDKEKKDVEGEVTFTEKKKAADSMDDFYYHAAKVAGVSTDADKTWVYDITMKDGQKLYEGKNQRVTLELNGVNKDADLSKFGVKVYHVEGWCKATRIKNVDVKGNKVTFWTNSFSPYVITIGDGVASTGAADASNPSTGDFSAVPVALLAAAALGATGFVAYKKRKAE